MLKQITKGLVLVWKGQNDDRLVARWETKGKRYLNLYQRENAYYYEGINCGGSLGNLSSDEEAIKDLKQPNFGAVTALQLDYPSTKQVYCYTRDNNQ